MVGRVSSPVLVGRDAEAERIADALGRAAGGGTAHLLLAGEAGIGKTRLTTEAARLARERGFRVLRGECVNLGGSSLPYGPFVEAFRGLVAELGHAEVEAVAGPAAPDLARLIPGLRAADDVPRQSEYVQARPFEAILGFLLRLAERSPVLLVVEDLHWADPATRDAIAFLVHATQGVPLATVGTFRSDELHRRHPLLPWLAELDRSGRVERLELERFDQLRLGTLLAGILGEPPGSDLVRDVHARSDGNPFFAEELLAAGGAGPGARLPPTLREILLARLATLPDAAAGVLGVAAVAGRSVEHDLLAGVAGLPEPELLESLAAAVAAHVLVVETGDGPERYAFRHALVQEAVYDELLPGERRRLHRAFAEALATADGAGGAPEAGHWAELAHHWAAAREDARAFDASLRAADAAIAALAFGAGLQEYERALELWDGLPDAAALAGFDRIDLLRRAGQAAYLAANYRRAVALRREAVAAVDPVADPVRAGILREELGRALWVVGDPAGSLEAYRAAVETIPAEPPTAERARVLSGLGQVLMLLARHRDSRALCEEAVTLARAVGARAQEGHALNTLGLDLVALGDRAAGIAALEEALRIARDLRIADDIGRAYVNLAEALDDAGRPADAVATTAEGIRVAEEVGVGSSYGHFIRLGGVAILTALGRWDEARRLLVEVESAAPTGSGPERYRLARTVALLVGEGAERAPAAVERALALVGDGSGPQFSAPIHGAAAEQALWRNDPAAALESAERGLATTEGTDDRHHAPRLARVAARAAADLAEQARAARDEGGLQAVRERLAAVRDRLAAIAPPADGGDEDAAIAAERATVDAEAARLEGTPDAAAWDAAAGQWERLGRRYLLAYARWREAEAALGQGDRGRAAGALAAAHAIAVELGAGPLRQAVEALGRRARIQLGGGQAPDAAIAEDAQAGDRFGLTPREREVLALVADGRTNRQIAEALFISESTAGVHVSNILGKLGVATRGEAGAVAFRLGMVGVEAAMARTSLVDRKVRASRHV